MCIGAWRQYTSGRERALMRVKYPARWPDRDLQFGDDGRAASGKQRGQYLMAVEADLSRAALPMIRATEADPELEHLLAERDVE